MKNIRIINVFVYHCNVYKYTLQTDTHIHSYVITISVTGHVTYVPASRLHLPKQELHSNDSKEVVDDNQQEEYARETRN